MRPALQHRIAFAPTRVPLPQHLADDYLESYICWREAATAVGRGYERWNEVERPDRALAFAAYGAALDREEEAARALCERVTRVRRWFE